jgi:hypothetical protein
MRGHGGITARIVTDGALWLGATVSTDTPAATDG